MDNDSALPPGHTLNEYRIESTLGVGGFGLTYLATDTNLKLRVALKEYLPGALAARADDGSVRPKSDAAADTFRWGRERFLDESRALAAFRHPNIVRVMRFFEANRTAYMVMEFVTGEAFSSWASARRPLDEPGLLAIADALLDGLDVIHRAGYLHRDIKPPNIFIRDDRSPVLLDFGSARMLGASTELTAIVTPGYAPFEQYHSQGNQGPWSDLYALGAVLYWAVTGERPIEAAARVRKDPLPPASVAAAGRYSPALLAAIDWALAPDEEGRPQSVAALRQALPKPAAVTAADRPTELVDFPPAFPTATAAPTTDTRFATTMAFDSETLRRIAADLAGHIGPIANVMVKTAAKKCFGLAQLAEQLGREIADDKARAGFVRKYTLLEQSTPVPASEPTRLGQTRPPSSPTGVVAGQPPSQPYSQVPSQPPGGRPGFDAATLHKAELELGKYLGAVARVVVKRAAGKARDISEFYLMLADEIEDKDERKAFVRKAISASGH